MQPPNRGVFWFWAVLLDAEPAMCSYAAALPLGSSRSEVIRLGKSLSEITHTLQTSTASGTPASGATSKSLRWRSQA